MSKSLLIIGCGDLGTRLGLKMAHENWIVYGLRRNITEIPPTIQGISVDLYQTDKPHNWPNETLDYVIFCVAPNKEEQLNYEMLYCHGLQNVLHWLHQTQQLPKHLFIVSSTAVYHQSDGEWVNEQSPTEPSTTQGKIMLVMEKLAFNSPISTTCIRLSGIYGPGRTYLINQAKQGIFYPTHPLLYSNRIHIDDAAKLIQQLITYHDAGNTPGDYYIGVDNMPCPIQEVLTWLQKELGNIEPHALLTQRRTSSKRLTNKQAKSIGWEPQYANYKEGYTALLKELM